MTLTIPYRAVASAVNYAEGEVVARVKGPIPFLQQYGSHMFNIILTIMALAFVVLLAGITAIHLGTDKGVSVGGRNAITATQALAQGQQLAAQATFFNSFEGRWPNSVQELLERGYLAAEPKMSFPASTDLASTTTSKATWTVLLPGQPLFKVEATLDELLCRELNKQVRGDNGILTRVSPNLTAQCFGTPGKYQIVYAATRESVEVALSGSVLPADESISSLQANLGSAYWAVPPDNTETQ